MIIDFSPFRNLSSDRVCHDHGVQPVGAFRSVSALDPSPSMEDDCQPGWAVIRLGSGIETLALMRGCYDEHAENEITKCYLTNDEPVELRNFLLLVPETDDILLDEPRLDPRVVEAAQRLQRDGFVYVAWSFQRGIEDDAAGVRYLSLRERLPSFGTMTAVIVIDDERWIDIAATGYPGAQIFLLRLKESQPGRHAAHLLQCHEK